MTEVFVAHPFTAIPIKGYRGVFERIAEEADDLEFKFADEHLEGPGLLDNIVSWIKDSDFVVIDLTPDDGLINPNVLVEFGIARAIKPRKLCPISRGDVADLLPWDLKGIHVHSYTSRNELYDIITAALCALGGYHNAREVGEDAIKEKIVQLFRNRNTQLSRGEIAERVNLFDLSQASRILNALVREGKLDYDGERRGRFYFKA